MIVILQHIYLNSPRAMASHDFGTKKDYSGGAHAK